MTRARGSSFCERSNVAKTKCNLKDLEQCSKKTEPVYTWKIGFGTAKNEPSEVRGMKVVAKTKDIVKLKSYYCCLIFIYSPVNGCDQTSKPSSPAGPSHGLPGVESSCSNTSEIAFLHGTAISGVQLFLRSCFFRTYCSMKVSSTDPEEVDFWRRSEEQRL